MTDKLTQALEAVARHAKERPKATTQPEPPPVAVPCWPDSRRAAPSCVLRAALFPALGRVKRRRLWDEPVFSVAGITITFRGEQLDQSDLDVYLEILHLMRDQAGQVTFSTRGLLQTLGRSTGKSDREWLRRVIHRLTAGFITIKLTDRPEYFGHLIDSGQRDESAGRYVLSIDSDFARTIRAAWSTLDIGQRQALKGPTAKALHAYLSSHRNPGPHRIDTLAGVAGLHGTNAKTTVLKALEELQAVGFLSGWDAPKDVVTLHQAPKLPTGGHGTASDSPRQTPKLSTGGGGTASEAGGDSE